MTLIFVDIPPKMSMKNSPPIDLHWGWIYWSPRKWQNLLNFLQGVSDLSSILSCEIDDWPLDRRARRTHRVVCCPRETPSSKQNRPSQKCSLSCNDVCWLLEYYQTITQVCYCRNCLCSNYYWHNSDISMHLSFGIPLLICKLSTMAIVRACHAYVTLSLSSISFPYWKPPIPVVYMTGWGDLLRPPDKALLPQEVQALV